VALCIYTFCDYQNNYIDNYLKRGGIVTKLVFLVLVKVPCILSHTVVCLILATPCIGACLAPAFATVVQVLLRVIFCVLYLYAILGAL
jgi:hypothetical protein